MLLLMYSIVAMCHHLTGKAIAHFAILLRQIPDHRAPPRFSMRLPMRYIDATTCLLTKMLTVQSATPIHPLQHLYAQSIAPIVQLIDSIAATCHLLTKTAVARLAIPMHRAPRACVRATLLTSHLLY